jgi:hypothetical protein
MPVTLTKPDGSIENAKGVLLTLFDQQWLRLGRLYTQVLETTSASRPEFNRGLPFRPAPRYIFFPTQTMANKSGFAEAWADMGFSGDARFYDGDGMPIDPVAVMAAFAAILTKFPVLQAVDLSDSPLSPLPLTNYLATLAPTSKTRLRFFNPDGTPYAGQHLTGVTAVNAGAGLCDLTAASATLDAVSASFTQGDRDRLVLGPGTSGRLSDTFTPPTLAAGVTVARDFYSLRVVSLNDYLVGQWPASTADPATGLQRKPTVRVNENITFLSDGNDLLGAINTALPAGSDPPIAVAQTIDGAFAIPAAPGAVAHWPQFPPGVPAGDPNASVSVTLKSQFVLTANWVTSTATDFKRADVVLKIEKLPDNAWARVYTRKFLPGAVEGRGDGAGALSPVGGTITLNLTDPFSLRGPTTPAATDVIVPANATLMFDTIVVLPNGKSRIFGNNTVHVGAPPATPPAPSGATNPCGTAAFRGISNSGILGLGTPAPPPPANLLQWAQALTGETQPRDASRLPTMARREMLVAGSQAGVWTGVIGGGRITAETICANARIGDPGSSGGRETSVVGASTHGGILANDIARHAFRRSQNILSRITALADNKWSVPAQPAAVGIGQPPSATNGTFAGAVLQTVAPYCETPELHAALELGVNVNTAIDYLVNNFVPSNLPGHDQVVNALNSLKTTPAAPLPASETSAEQRIAVELEREVTSSFFGRRDAQWALKSAIGAARHFIYIETPGFCSTASASPSGYAADLISLIKTQLTARPGLRIAICVPKQPDFAPGYEGMTSYEVQDRLLIVRGRTTAPVVTPLPNKQSIVFHPVGFPGRFARIESNVVIVDDIWGMAGACSFRRRGLTFDGSSDLVFTDTLIENGRSAAIRDFRRGLMAGRLGIPADSSAPSFVALSDAATAFKVVSDAVGAGGLGNITPVWDGTAPGVTLATALPADNANPDGRDLDFATALLIAALGAASGV